MLKDLLKKFIYKHKATSESYVQYLKKIGVACGDNIRIFCPHDTTIDTLNPHLLTIGSNVAITGPSSILTHDYSVFVANHLSKGKLYGKQQPVIIGNNVFLGWGGVVLPGTTVGDNVIIGAYAVVSGNVEANSVYAGNPAKRICSIEEYIDKRERQQLKEAVDIYIHYFKRFGKTPEKEVFHEYFYLFSKENNLSSIFEGKIIENKNFDECMQYLLYHKPLFESYDEFSQYAMEQYRKN